MCACACVHEWVSACTPVISALWKHVIVPHDDCVCAVNGENSINHLLGLKWFLWRNQGVSLVTRGCDQHPPIFFFLLSVGTEPALCGILQHSLLSCGLYGRLTEVEPRAASECSHLFLLTNTTGTGLITTLFSSNACVCYLKAWPVSLRHTEIKMCKAGQKIVSNDVMERKWCL